MTERERVSAVLSHKPTDFIPCTVGLTIGARERLAAYPGGRERLAAFPQHIASVHYDGIGWETVREGYVRDGFGIVWNRTVDRDIGVVEDYPIKAPDPALIRLPAIYEERWRASLENLCKSENLFRAAAIGFSMFERAWTMRGMVDLLMDMVDHPSFVDELLDAICDFNLRVMDIALQYPIDAFYFGDDWGQQHGLIMGPTHWRRFIKPRMAVLYERARRAGKFVLQHSCGDISCIYPDLIDIGLHCHQTFQPEIYDPAWFARTYGDRLSVWGGISTQQVLPHGTPRQVQEETIAIMRAMRGCIIAAPTHGIPHDTPPENILAMMDVMEHQDKYL